MKITYLAPVLLPLATVALARLVVFACGLDWTTEVGGFIAFLVLIIVVPAGIAIAIIDNFEDLL